MKGIDKYWFNGFGLKIKSDIHLPELAKGSQENGKADLDIKYKDLNTIWKAHSEKDRVTAVVDDLVLFKVPDVGIFGCKAGHTIFLSPFNTAESGEIRLFVLGTCMGIILLQKKILPLHGSAVVIDGKVYAFVGEQGAGKSTLAHAFIKHGMSLMTDDIIAVSFNKGIPYVIPAYPQQKLWKESLDAFDIETGSYQALFERSTKFAVPVQKEFFQKPLPLAGIFELTRSPEKKVRIQHLSKLHSLWALKTHTYRNFLLKTLTIQEWHFDQITRIASSVTCSQILRPENYFSAHEIVEKILNSIYLEVLS